MVSAKRYDKSRQAFGQACRHIPGGVNSPVRAFGSVDNDPLFIDRAKGSKIYDIDGNEYIDYVGSWGPMILGHSHPKIIEAVKAAVENGTSFGAPTESETRLAEKIVAAFNSIEKVRLLSSGTEAVMTAIRLARAFTKRDYIIKMAGCYHGHSDSLLVAAGSGAAENGIASSGGVPQSLAELTIVVDYNDAEAVSAVFEKYKNKIAACIIEPVAANMGVVLPDENYLQRLGDLCSANNALLIFDEVITGFRLCYGGADKIFGVKADLTCLGKIIGGGLPAAALGGKSEIMDMLAPAGDVYQAGTLSGNPLATAAANATLNILKGRECYEKLENSAKLIQAGIQAAANDFEIPMTINRIGSIMNCFFTDKPIKNFADVKASNTTIFKKFFAGMLNSGIYLAPSPFEAMFISTAHSKQDIAKTIKAAQNIFRTIANN